MKTEPLRKTNQNLYIIDYDIPRKPQSKRRAFYRQLTKIKHKMGSLGKISTMSVLVTPDQALATQIYDLARKYGKANLYLGFRKGDDEKKLHNLVTRATLFSGKRQNSVTRAT